MVGRNRLQHWNPDLTTKLSPSAGPISCASDLVGFWTLCYGKPCGLPPQRGEWLHHIDWIHCGTAWYPSCPLKGGSYMGATDFMGATCLSTGSGLPASAIPKNLALVFFWSDTFLDQDGALRRKWLQSENLLQCHNLSWGIFCSCTSSRGTPQLGKKIHCTTYEIYIFSYICLKFYGIYVGIYAITLSIWDTWTSFCKNREREKRKTKTCPFGDTRRGPP